MIRRPPKYTRVRSSAASDVYKRQVHRLVVQPKASGRLRDKIFDHRKIVPVHTVEHVIAMDADVIYDALPCKAHPDTEIDYSISWGRRVTLAKPGLACGKSRFNHAHVC